MLQDDDHYDKRDVPSLPKRAKTEEAPAGPLATPPDPYAAMALYYSKLHSSFRPWSPKAGFPGPGLPGYSLPHPFSRAGGGGGGGPLPDSALELRRPEELPGHGGPQLHSPHFRGESPHTKKKLGDKGEQG